jgi:hypothetical protein
MRSALGQASPNCPTGYYPAPLVCPNPTDYKITLDPSGSGCQRCDKKTAAEMSSDYCIRAIQFYLQGQGQLTAASVTGTWNDETRRILALRLGPSWESYSGGACGILASFGAGVLPNVPGYPGMYPGYPGYQVPSSITPQTLLLLGGGAVLLLLLLKR